MNTAESEKYRMNGEKVSLFHRPRRSLGRVEV